MHRCYSRVASGFWRIKLLRGEERNSDEFPPRNSTVGITLRTYDERTKWVKHRAPESDRPRPSLNSGLGLFASDEIVGIDLVEELAKLLYFVVLGLGNLDAGLVEYVLGAIDVGADSQREGDRV
jgi:hypothetical protein